MIATFTQRMGEIQMGPIKVSGPRIFFSEDRCRATEGDGGCKVEEQSRPFHREQAMNMQSVIKSSEKREPSPKGRPFFHFWRCFWLTFHVVSLGYAWHSFYVPPNDIAWAKDYTSAQRQAAISGKPIVLYFTATWCVPCRIMKRQVWADKQVKELVNAAFVPVAIDASDPENAEIMNAYKIEGTPVTIVCDSRGNVVDWRAGGIGKLEFLELVNSSNLPSE